MMEVNTANTDLSQGKDTVQRLQDEIATLRAELQELRSSTRLETSQSTARACIGQTFRFLKLPRELRNAVYELCVAVDEVRIARPDRVQSVDMRYNYPTDAKAEISLFCLNKQVRQESSEVYLSKNHFVIPAAVAGMSWCIGKENLARYIPGYYKADHHQYLRSISISLDFHEGICHPMDEDGPDQFHLESDGRDEIAPIRDHHNDFATGLDYHFVRTLAATLNANTHLRRFQINVQNAACSNGCHRLIELVFEEEEVQHTLAYFAYNAHKLEALDFLGTVNEYERRAILSAMWPSLRNKVTFHGQFNALMNKWDPDVNIVMDTHSQRALDHLWRQARRCCSTVSGTRSWRGRLLGETDAGGVRGIDVSMVQAGYFVFCNYFLGSASDLF